MSRVSVARASLPVIPDISPVQKRNHGLEGRAIVSTGVKGDQFRRFESTHPAPSARRR